MANADLVKGAEVPEEWCYVPCPKCGHDIIHHHDKWEGETCEVFEGCGCDVSWQGLVAWFRHIQGRMSGFSLLDDCLRTIWF